MTLSYENAYVCVRFHLYAYVCVCMLVRAQACVCMLVRAHACGHVLVRAYAYVCVCVHMLVYALLACARKCVRFGVYACMRAFLCVRTRVCDSQCPFMRISVSQSLIVE